jgi:hypothetical protein
METTEWPGIPVEADCKHWFSYPGFAEWYANFSKPEPSEDTVDEEVVSQL